MSRPFISCLLAFSCLACTTVPPTTERSPSLPTIAVDGYRFHAQVFGRADAPVIVVIHGGPGADHRYLLALKDLSDTHRVVFYDQRGSGLSPRVPKDTITVDQFIADLDAIISATSHNAPVDLIGHSWGAMLASAYMGRHPEKVRSAVLAEPAFLSAATADIMSAGGSPSAGAIVNLSLAWLASLRVDTRSDPNARDDYFFGRAMTIMQPDDSFCGQSRPLLEHWRAGATVFQQTAGRAMNDQDFRANLDFSEGVAKFGGRVLLLSGACNRVDGPIHQQKHLPLFQRAELAIVPHAGHFMFNDNPDAALAMVRTFLSAPPP